MTKVFVIFSVSSKKLPSVQHAQSIVFILHKHTQQNVKQNYRVLWCIHIVNNLIDLNEN